MTRNTGRVRERAREGLQTKGRPTENMDFQCPEIDMELKPINAVFKHIYLYTLIIPIPISI